MHAAAPRLAPTTTNARVLRSETNARANAPSGWCTVEIPRRPLPRAGTKSTHIVRIAPPAKATPALSAAQPSLISRPTASPSADRPNAAVKRISNQRS